MAKKQISDIVRDKIIRARSKNKTPITLTDQEACEIWSALTSVEAEVHKLKSIEFKAMKERFARIEKELEVSKKRIKKVKSQGKREMR